MQPSEIKLCTSGAVIFTFIFIVNEIHLSVLYFSISDDQIHCGGA